MLLSRLTIAWLSLLELYGCYSDHARLLASPCQPPPLHAKIAKQN